MSNVFDLEKAKGSALATHFKKGAAFHEKKAEHHEKCMKAHQAAADHHESMMGKAEDNLHAHHKAKAAFHKTMAGHHDKAAKLHKAHAEHHQAMADAHTDQPDTQKAAFAKLEIELVEKVTPTATVTTITDPAVAATTAAELAAKAAAVVDPQTVVVPPTAVIDPKDPKVKAVTAPTGVLDMSKTAAELAAAATAAATTISAADPDNPLQKQLSEGLNEALRNGLKEILASPEFRKTVQEQLGNVLINELGKQTLAPSSIKTFAVARPGIDPSKTATIASGGTPKIDTTGVDPEFASLVSMEN